MQIFDKQVPNYKGKKVVVLGLGKAGVASAKFLHSRGAKVHVSDLKPKDRLADAARDLGQLDPTVEFEWGANSIDFFNGAELVVCAPSVSSSNPLLAELRTRGVQVLSPIELALREITVPIVTFSGAYGKTSAAVMTKYLLEASGKRTFLAGDMHGSLIEAVTLPQPPEVVLLELSEMELERVSSLKPSIAVLTNLFRLKPAEYATIEDYYRVAMGVLRNTDESSAIVYNFRDPALRMLVPPFPGKKFLVRRKDIPPQPGMPGTPRGSFMMSTRDVIWTNGEVREEYDLRFTPVFGLHNKDNLSFAINVARILGCPQAAVQTALHKFPGVPHRMQLVKKRGGVRFINDSRSLGPHDLERALDAFALDPVILIAGGKQTPDANFSSLVDFVKKRVKTMILVGEAKEQINRDLGDFTETFLVGTFEEAVLLSYQKSREGDVILLSPGCESYDMFTSYEERGNYFIKYLDEL